VKGPARLVDQLLPVNEDDDAVPLGARPLRDVGEQDSLAGAGWAHHEGSLAAGAVGLAHAVDEVELVVAELDHGRRSSLST
jgi:hypothetical protein